MSPDFIYLLKDVPSGSYEELRYSLRSVQANAPLGTLWLVGGRPEWSRGTDLGHIHTGQTSVKYLNTRENLRAAVKCEQISDPFILMNDDFFLMKPQKELQMLHGGSFGGWLAALRSRVGRSSYVRGGEETLRLLKQEGLPSVCWSLHTPLLVYKEPMQDALDLVGDHPKQLHVRTLYGNLAELPGVLATDVKISDRRNEVPGSRLYLSTTDGSFESGRIGRTIREAFPEKSKWERN